ncbi:hypothetical protein LWI28_018264 [Acer negundo]|uniref:Uncharacterized protein n=1 Tax=Acer negundo TaxID=4023 RepID=A0AAD5IUS2_ACENE|nr:hypothetical protein LWI28_018264 [Acer negundo]
MGSLLGEQRRFWAVWAVVALPALFSVAFGFAGFCCSLVLAVCLPCPWGGGVVGLSLLRGKENTGHKAKQTPQKGQAQVPKQPQEEEEQQYKAKQAKKDPATKATEQQETAQQKENHDN